MEQTPVHEIHNQDLLGLLPVECRRIIEIGCSSGALAREYKKINPTCQYTGIDVHEDYCSLAKRYCDVVMSMDIEEAGSSFYEDQKECDCWIFGDTLEHLRDPWRVLARIRQVIPAAGHVLASIPNAQHWSIFARLSVGDFRYQSSGLMDRTHLRWFTRQTIVEMFSGAGFKIVSAVPRVFKEPAREPYLKLIGELAKETGMDPLIAQRDALALQYVVKAVPA